MRDNAEISVVLTPHVFASQLQYAPPSRGLRLPSSLVSKGFTFSQGKLNLEVTLDKETYYHGEKLAANVIISNNSRKSVRNIKVSCLLSAQGLLKKYPDFFFVKTW